MTHTPRTLPVALFLLLAAPLAAGQQAPGPDRQSELEELARAVGAAHRPEGPTPGVDAFRCQLELHLLDVTEQNGGQANLDVQFLQQRRKPPKKPRTYIRYEVRGAEQEIRRGFDRVGPWHVKQGRPQDLTAAGAEQDLESLREHTNLARQLVRFLSPEAVIAALDASTAVIDDTLRVGRREVPALSVSGRLPKFPLMQGGGDEAPAYVTIYVDKTSKRLLGVDAWPLRDGKADRARGERILLSDLELQDSLLIPRTLRYLWRNESGALRSHSTVKVLSLDLRPKLSLADFDRR